MKNLFNGKSKANGENTTPRAPRDRDEKRRLLLNKNNELNHSFDNNKLSNDTEAVQRNGIGVVAKLQGTNKKIVSLVVAIAVVLTSVLAGINFAVKAVTGAQIAQDNTYVSDEFTGSTYTLNGISNQPTYRATVTVENGLISAISVECTNLYSVTGSTTNDIAKQDWNNHINAGTSSFISIANQTIGDDATYNVLNSIDTSSGDNTFKQYGVMKEAVLNAIVNASEYIPEMETDEGSDPSIHYSYNHVTNVDGLYLNKSVSKVNDNNYNVKLEAFAEASSIEQPITDIVMTMDLSKRMGLNLYNRTNWKNLNTHTTFTLIPESERTPDNLHDNENPLNRGDWSGFISRSFSGNKYVEDPNIPGTYVYVSSRYEADGFLGIGGLVSSLYTYHFTDGYGNEYEAEVEGGLITGQNFSANRKLTFNRIKQVDTTVPSVTSYEVNEFYQRNDDTSLNTELLSNAGTSSTTVTEWLTFYYEGNAIGWGAEEKSWNDTSGNYSETKKQGNWMSRNETVTYSGGLYIISDTGNKLPVTVEVERKATRNHNIFGYGDPTYYNYKYTYKVTDPESGKTYTAVQGNSEYGADYGVFQGFKTYTKENGVLKVDHSNSIESKSLYIEENQTVTRLQAMKEAAEKFLIQLHTDAWKKNTDLSRPNVRLSLITYGVGSTVHYDLPDINLANEVQVNAAIDKIYSFTASNRYASELDYAMQDAYAQFYNYSREGTNTAPDNDGGKENKKISVLFSSGTPTRAATNWLGNPKESESYFNETVANSAIDRANVMKNFLGVTSYTVGLFNDASDTNFHGEKFEYSQKRYHPDVACSGDVGSAWGSTTFSYLLNGWVHNIDVPATNRVMNYISSNFSDADELGLTWKTGLNPGHYTWRNSGMPTLGGSGWQITKNYNSSANGYYFAIPINENVGETIDAEMRNVFEDIADSIEIPSSQLDANDYLVDYVSDYFTINGDVTAHTESPDDATHYSTTTWFDNQDSRIITTDGNTISVNGFDYNGHNMTSYSPQKLVVEFSVKRVDGLVGGNLVPTNTTLSGVYDAIFEEDDNGQLILDEDNNPIIRNTLMEEAFRLPEVDLSIKASNMVKDASVFYGNVQNLSELMNPESINGFNNRFVQVQYEIYDDNVSTSTPINTYTVTPGNSIGSWTNKITADEGGGNVQNLDKVFKQMTDTTEFRIVCTIDPTLETTGRNGSLTTVETILDEEEDPVSTVYVFKPYVEVHNDRLQSAGTYNFTDDPNPELVSWNVKDANGNLLNGEALAAASGLLPKNADGTQTLPAPATSFDLDPVDSSKYSDVTDLTSYQVDETMDFVVAKVIVTQDQYTYESWEHMSHEEEDENNNTIIVDDGYGWVSHTMNAEEESTNKTNATYANGGVSFLNTSENDARTNGQFTITVGKFFNMTIDKWFTGDYANPQKVIITVTPFGDNNNLDSSKARTVTFEKADFERDGDAFKAKQVETLSGLEANTKYRITELFDAGDTEKENYTITFNVDGELVVDGNNPVTTQLDYEKGNDEATVAIRVVNDSIPITIEGVVDETNTLHIILYILVFTAIIGGGAGIAYLYRKKDEFVER